MGILGILFRQERAVIAPSELGSTSITDKFKGVFRYSTVGSTTGIVIDATVREEHSSTCEVSENPVEEGADVTDHVYVRPPMLSIEGVITDTPLGFAAISNVQNLVTEASNIFGFNNPFGGSGSRSIDAFNSLVNLQKTRKPFTVLTGLKRYENMILEDLHVPRTAETGNAIHFTANFRQVRLVQSQLISTANLNQSVKSLAAKTVDKGGQVTPPTEASSGLIGKFKEFTNTSAAIFRGITGF